MVEVIEKSEEEKKLEEKVKNLTNIANKFLREKRKFLNFARNYNGLVLIHNYNPFKWFVSYFADCENNTIHINKLKDYDFARVLAEFYEEQFKENWILKKDYNE